MDKITHWLNLAMSHAGCNDLGMAHAALLVAYRLAEKECSAAIPAINEACIICYNATKGCRS